MEPLKLLSGTQFESKAPRGFPVGCPTLDVVTTWDGGSSSLLIYRPPGQVVSKVNQISAPGAAAPVAVAARWKPDGQFLAVGWSDGVVRLMGLENNKAAHHLPVCQGSVTTTIKHIGWASSNLSRNSFPGSSTSWERSEISRHGGVTDEDWANHGDQLPANLPQELTFLEVETALPKLSPLPASSAGADADAIVFTLRTGIEFLFQPLRPDEYDTVNVMVVGTCDGGLQLSIHDSLVVGAFQCPAVGSASTACHMVLHASHPAVSTHALVLADSKAQDVNGSRGKDDPESEHDELHLLPMDLPFLSPSPVNLSLLASKLTTLQKLLRYLRQTQLHMLVEWNNARELPARFLRSVSGDLDKMPGGPRSIVAALYHTVVTGHYFEPVREWLADSLGERGHKRWDKAVTSGLEGIRTLVHENLLPALERCAIILSRLRGLAQFHQGGGDDDGVGLAPADVVRALDSVAGLTLVGHALLTRVMNELDHFAAFSAWLRLQIDRLTLGASALDRLAEREATIDHKRVLAYIERYLVSSPLAVFFNTSPAPSVPSAHAASGPKAGSDDEDEEVKARARCDAESDLSAFLSTLLDGHEFGSPNEDKENNNHVSPVPLRTSFLVDYLARQCGLIFAAIAESKKRSVRFGRPVRLSLGRPVRHVDVRVCEATHGGVIFAALACKDDDTHVCIFRVRVDIVNGISSNQPVACCRVDLDARHLIDLKFLGDKSLVLLCSHQDQGPTVILVPIHSDSLPFAPYSPDKPGQLENVATDNFSEYLVPAQQQQQQTSSRPVRMEVHEESDVRGRIPQRICLLGSNGTTWQTFSIPRQKGGGS